MTVGEIDNRTSEEIIADLEERRKGHVFMTTEAAQAWNESRGKKPLPDSHWLIKQKADRKKLGAMIDAIHRSYEHRLLQAARWKALAIKMRDDVANLEEQLLRAKLTPRTKRKK